MPDLAVFLSNPGHHVATMAPVIDYVAQRGVSSKIFSFCELRGFASPTARFAAGGNEVVALWPRALRRAPGGPGEARALGLGRRRRLLQTLAWRLILGPGLARRLEPVPRFAVLPNDSAFPYDRLAALLARRRIPYVLVQEGIRFPLPAERASRYGLGGARALAVWGEASAEHFRALGIEPSRIHVTGSPRFDHNRPGARQLPGGSRRGSPALLLITNPIDAQGFCSTAQKTALVAQLVSHLRQALSDGRLTLTLRPHPGEKAGAYLEALAPEDRDLLSFDDGSSLDDAMSCHDIAIVMASTVGLEALQKGLALAVLPTPGHGFVHDYVERHAAIGLVMDDSLPAQLLHHAAPSAEYQDAVDSYLDYHLAHSGQATQQVGQLMIDLLDDE
jgi:hypothetical protein